LQDGGEEDGEGRRRDRRLREECGSAEDKERVKVEYLWEAMCERGLGEEGR
jgi:hypothetical protein